ncbi:DUF2652 domain-containing protein [Salegentibacter sp. JZCK2]|uniref:DUF2652 domain-containing protein n=1 Tax=Salegentibacter tibetensis TaxID=2873600 RepID=UPI001CCC4C35|nr:DUF2652 domain-containing protein [Salegentibacter tibetensis]MBZ9730865.1 DUF2652 domain-containing protein [Salegentibacter tibetensis]
MKKNYPGIKKNQAFYFIPDISGFSQFVENTAIEHSIHIISELLEILLDNNVLNMELAEVEGDALFMYSEKDLSFSEVENQVTSMLNAFREHLYKYEHQRICSCGACSTAINLRIKFLLHKGRLDFIKVKNIKKPYGQDVNRIHRLLKNDVPLDEYLLLSNPTFNDLKLELEVSGFNKMESAYDIHILPYYYKDLKTYKTPVKKKASQNSIPIDEKSDFIIERDIKLPIEKAFELISNFKYRQLWDSSLTGITFDEAQVNRSGSNHTCIIGSRKMKFETVGIDSKADLSYGEKTSNLPMAKNYRFYILLDKLDHNTTRMKVLNYLQFNWMGRLMRKSVYRKLETTWNAKLIKLEEVGEHNF